MGEEQDDALVTEGAAEEEDGAQHVCLVIKHVLPTRRIDKYLQHRFNDFSRSIIQRLIREEAVTVNGRPTKASYQLSPQDRVDVILPPVETNEIPAEDIPLDIVYEDDHMLVVNKQADLVVHPARGNQGGTLVNGLVNYSDKLSSGGGPFRVGIVHRLDRNTTGLILVAKTDTAHWRLAHQFEHRQVEKTYIAVVHGRLELDSDVINLPLGRHRRVREKYAVQPEAGKGAVTRYQVLEQYRGYALVRLMPKTGRTHQLRVHMSSIKHPIVSDTMYGGKVPLAGQLADGAVLDEGEGLDAASPVISRQALHAAELTIRHPETAEKMRFVAPLPRDMELLIKLLARWRGV